MTDTLPAPARTVSFGPARHEVYDVYGPDGGDRPLVVLVHGGFWRVQYDRSLLHGTATALAQAGHPVALVEYRGIATGPEGSADAAADGPQVVADVLTAVREVLRRERPREAVLLGHSAGGHLALLAAHALGRDGLAGDDGPVRAVLALAGVLDLQRTAALGLGEDVALAFAGGPPDRVPEAYAVLDPAALGTCPVPVTAVHGERDEDVPALVARSWRSRAGLPGRDRLVELPGCGHFDVVEPSSAAWPVVLRELEMLAQPHRAAEADR